MRRLLFTWPTIFAQSIRLRLMRGNWLKVNELQHNVVAGDKQPGKFLRCMLLTGVGLVLGTLPAIALANGNIKVFQYTDKKGNISFSDRQPLDVPFTLVKFDCFACNVRSTTDWDRTPLFPRHYLSEIEIAAAQHQLDPALIQAVIHAESGFRPKVVSRSGAQGLMQLMPGTAKDMAVKDVFQPSQNIMGGSAYLAWLLKKYDGNLKLATAAYNAGPATVSKYGGIPPYPETKTYVARVDTLYKRYRAQRERLKTANADLISQHKTSRTVKTYGAVSL